MLFALREALGEFPAMYPPVQVQRRLVTLDGEAEPREVYLVEAKNLVGVSMYSPEDAVQDLARSHIRQLTGELFNLQHQIAAIEKAAELERP
jgi:hypothetical protein